MNYLVVFFTSSLFLFYSCSDNKSCTNCPPLGSDTTSHNFVWYIDTLGDGAGSKLNDLVIVNDTLVFAVGEITKKDSIGNWDYEPYGLATWNGRFWELRKIYYASTDGSRIIFSNIRGIIYLNSSEIWFAAGSIFRWDGISSTTELSYSRLSLADSRGSIEKLWGSSKSLIYGVGNSGTIVYYNGTTWTRIDSDPTLDIYDIHGSWNDDKKFMEIIAAGAQQFDSNNKTILRLSGITTQALSCSDIPYSIHGIWFKPDLGYFIVGSGIYFKNSISGNDSWKWLHEGISQYYIYCIDGNNVNDVMAAGEYGELLHFNGSTWKSFQSETAISADAYISVKIRGNICVAVGYKSQVAIIAIGRRQ